MFRFSHYLPSVLCLLILASPVLAQRDRDTYSSASATSLEIVGQVRVIDTGLPASRVPVRLERFGGGLVDQIDTDGNGRFRFANIGRGYFKVIVNAPGFQPVQQDADLQVVFRAYLVFELARQAAPLALIDVIDSRAPGEAREELVKGRSALSKKSYAESVAHFEKAIFLYPDFYEAHLLLGTALMDSKEWKKAETSFQRAVELKNNSGVALLALGETYWRQKRYDEAEKTLLEGLKLEEKSWHGHFTLARLYWDLDNIAKAGPALGRSMQLKPDFGPAHLLAGNILLKINQQQRALAAYQEYLRLDPKGEFAPQTRELVGKLSQAVGKP